MHKGILIGAAAMGLALSGCNQAPSPDMQELADKAAIEELLVSYYSHFGGTANEDFAAYYTDDGVFDVNGVVAQGKEAIVGVYAGLDAENDQSEQSTPNDGVFHMLATNIQVDVDGDTATAKLFWTGILNTDPFGPPHLQEHGREYDKFVKVDGKWLIQHRVVIADSAMPEMFRATYQPRLDYDINAPETAAPATAETAEGAAE